MDLNATCSIKNLFLVYLAVFFFTDSVNMPENQHKFFEMSQHGWFMLLTVFLLSCFQWFKILLETRFTQFLKVPQVKMNLFLNCIPYSFYFVYRGLFLLFFFVISYSHNKNSRNFRIPRGSINPCVVPVSLFYWIKMVS